MTLTELLETNSDFSALSTAIKVAGLAHDISELENVTVFAPSNEVFKTLTTEKLQNLFGDPETLKLFLLNHIASGNYTLLEIAGGAVLNTLSGLQGTGIVYTAPRGAATGGVKIDCAKKFIEGGNQESFSGGITTADIMLENNVVVQVLGGSNKYPVGFMGLECFFE